jgi:hypothetical protein
MTGDIIQLNMMGEPMLILNSVKDAEEIVCWYCITYL